MIVKLLTEHHLEFLSFKGGCRGSSESCLFVWFDSLCPINNLSVKQGRVFLGWTSTKLGQMCLAQGPQHICSDACEARPRRPSVSSQALYHWAAALPPTLTSWVSRSKERKRKYITIWFSTKCNVMMTWLRPKSILDGCRPQELVFLI